MAGRRLRVPAEPVDVLLSMVVMGLIREPVMTIGNCTSISVDVPVRLSQPVALPVSWKTVSISLATFLVLTVTVYCRLTLTLQIVETSGRRRVLELRRSSTG